MFSRNIKAFCSDESACHRAHSPGHLFISPLSRLKSNFLFSLCHRTEPMHFSDKTPPLAHRSRKPFFISSMLIKLEVLCTRNLVLCKSRVVFYFPARKPPSCLAVCSKYARDVCVCVCDVHAACKERKFRNICYDGWERKSSGGAADNNEASKRVYAANISLADWKEK